MTRMAQIFPLVGLWETDSVDVEAIEKDRDVLGAIIQNLPPGVSSVELSVTLHGRRWTFHQLGPRSFLTGPGS